MNKYLFKIQDYFKNSTKKNPFSLIIALIIFIFIALFYFTIPAYYNYENFDKEIQKKVSKDFKIDLKNIKGIKYLILPSPHFLIEECDLYLSNDKSKKLLNVKNLTINVFSKNLHKKEKIELKNINLNKMDLDVQFLDFKNFYNHLRNNITKPIYLNNSNLFFRNDEKEIILISKIKKLEYYFDLQNREKKLNILGNLFGSNFNFNWEKNFNNPYISLSNIKFNYPNLNISSKYDKKNDDFTIAETKIKFLTNFINLNYKFNSDNIEFFENANKKNLDNQLKLIGNINLKPFFFDLNMILSDIELQTVLNNLLLNLYKVNKGTHLNFNGNLKINLGEFNNRLFENLVLNINFFEEKITLSKSTLYLKKIGKISFSEPTFFERNQKLFLNTRIRFDIFDQNQLFKRFQIPKKNRRDLTKVYFELEYNVDDSEYFLSDINYDDKVKEDNNFYEVNNIQQLTNLISKEFEEISKD